MRPGFVPAALLATLVAGTTVYAAAAPSADLAQMETQLAKLRLHYTDKHPDVIALLQKINAERELQGMDRAPATQQPADGDDLQAATERLQVLRKMYTETHPEVIAQKKRVEELQRPKAP